MLWYTVVIEYEKFRICYSLCAFVVKRLIRDLFNIELYRNYAYKRESATTRFR